MSAKAEAVEALCQLATNGDEADRCYACQALGAIDAKNAIAVLIERLADPDIDVCVDAAGAIGRLGASDAIPGLLASLYNDPDGEIKTAVVEALAQIGHADAIPALLEIAANRPEQMVFDEAEGWDPWWDMQLKAVTALGQLRVSKAVPILGRILDDEDGQDIESEALSALSRVGAEGEPILLQRLQQGNERERRRAARALTESSSQRAQQALLHALSDPAASVRAAATRSLGHGGVQRYLGALLRRYRDRDPEVRAAAAEAVARLSAFQGELAQDVPVLLSDSSSQVKAAVLRILAQRAAELEQTILQKVIAALNDSDVEVASNACALLGKNHTPKARECLLQTLGSNSHAPLVRRQAGLALAEQGQWDDVIALALTQAVTDSEQQVRLGALDALRRLEIELGDTAASSEVQRPLELIIATLAGQTVPIDSQVDLPDPDAEIDPAQASAEVLETASTAGSEQPVKLATSTLEAIALDNAEIAQALQTEASASDPEQNGATEGEDECEGLKDDIELDEYLAIVERNNSATQWLFNRDKAPIAEDVRRLAARILGEIPLATTLNTVMATLLDAVDSSDRVLQQEAAESLGRLAWQLSLEQRARVSDKLLTLLGASDATSDNRDLRIHCVRALGRLAHPSAQSQLLVCLEDDDTVLRIEAIHALTGLAMVSSPQENVSQSFSLDVAERLLPLLDDKEVGIRLAAVHDLVALLKSLNIGERDIGERASLFEQALERIIAAAFAGGGGQAREMGRGLRALAPEPATKHLLALLQSLSSSAERRFAIAMLEELQQPIATS